MLHHRRQGHRERSRQFGHRQAFAFAQLRDQRAAGRVGKGGEGAVEVHGGQWIVNQLVKYMSGRFPESSRGVCDLLRQWPYDESMSSTSLAAVMAGAQMSNTHMALAARMLKMNADAKGAIAQVLEAAQQNIQHLASLPAGVGQKLDVSA